MDNPNEPVTLTRGQLDGILAELSNLKSRGATKKPKRVTDRTATLRFHEGKPVITYGQVREVKDPTTGRMVSYMEIETKSEEGPVKATVGYLEFLNSANSYQVSIKSQKAEEVIQSLGTFQAQNPDEAKVGSSAKGWRSREVENEVKTFRYIVDIEVLEGEYKGLTLTVSAEALNR